MKNVQIPYELFVSLLRYHLMEDDDCLNEIRQGLEQKLDSLVMSAVFVPKPFILTVRKILPHLNKTTKRSQ